VKTKSLLRDEKETDTLRKSGIEVTGNIPWGTHLCQLYETREDLIEILVPYFAEGLRNNEFCMWVTSEGLSEKEAEKAMRRAVPNFDRYLIKGQMEIVPHTEWYLKDGAFNLQRVLNAWIDKLNQALAKGYDGIRVTGNTAWLEKRDWKIFTEYEEEVNNVIGKYQMMAICTYSLDRCGASEVIDVVRNHRFALIRRRGEWELMESYQLKRAREARRESEERYRTLFERSRDAILITTREGKVVEANQSASDLFGYTREEMIRLDVRELYVHPDDRYRYQQEIERRGSVRDCEVKLRKKDGTELDCLLTATVWRADDGGILGYQCIIHDITERKQAEEEIRKVQERFSGIYNSSKDAIGYASLEGVLLDVNDSFCKLTGYSREELLAGKKYQDITPKEYHEYEAKTTERILRTGKPAEYEKEYVRKDGSCVPILLTTFVVKGADGKPIGLAAIIKDVTERKQKEEALRRSEEQARHLLEFQSKVIDTAVVWVDLLDAEGNVTLWNRAAELISGYSRAEVIGHKKIWEWLYPDPKYRAEIFAEAKKIIERGERVENFETIIRCKDGTLKTISWYSNNILDEKGNPVGSIAVGSDITERKRAEQTIRESQEKFKELFMGNPEAAVYLDSDSHILDVNSRFEELFGYSLDEIKGMRINDVIVPKDKMEEAETVDKKALEGYFYHHDTIRKRRDGSLVPVSISAAPITVESKRIGYVILYKDITERKQMEKKLEEYSHQLEEMVEERTKELLESERRYSTLLELANDGVLILQDGVFVLVNKKTEGITKYSREELLGMPFLELISEKHREIVMDRYKQRLEGKTVPQIYEIEIVTKNGHTVPVEVSAKLIDYRGKPADLVIARDIRERKRMEEERLRLEKLATIGELATMVGHDLRNPLQAIENAAYYLNNELSRLPSPIPIPQKAMEMLQVLNDSVDYADKIIRDLKDFASTKKPILEKTDINAIVKSALSQVGARKNVELITELDHLPKIEVDIDMIKRVFLNLAINGIQAMEKGGTMTVSTKKTNGFVEASFKDTGVGISKENMEKLFTPFFTTRAKGMGMGLPICKKFVEAHGGSIQVESEEGKGSTFTVKLSIRQENGGEKLDEG